MARGWESKAVESQLEDKTSEDTRHRAGIESPEERTLRDERQGLELTRARLLAELKASTVPAHRTMLEQALADIQQRLDRFATTSRPGT
jgi:hypothetical protein